MLERAKNLFCAAISPSIPDQTENIGEQSPFIGEISFQRGDVGRELNGLRGHSMKRFLAGALLCVASNSSMAQPSVATNQILQSLAGTTHTTALPQFSDGKLNGCIIEFAVLAQDHIYRQGAFVRVGGSFGMMSAGNNVAMILKVIVHDIDNATMQLSPSPPASAYIVSGTTTTKPFFVAKYPSDIPGALFSIFKLDGALPILLDGITKEKMVIAFNRREGGADMRVAIDLTIEDTANDGRKTVSTKASQEFLYHARRRC